MPRIPAWPAPGFDPWLANTQLPLVVGGGGGGRDARKNDGGGGHRVPRVTSSPKVQTCTRKPSTFCRKDIFPFVRQESKLRPPHLDCCASGCTLACCTMLSIYDAPHVASLGLIRLNAASLLNSLITRLLEKKQPCLTSQNELGTISSSLRGVTPRDPESRATNFENFAEVFESSTSSTRLTRSPSLCFLDIVS